MTLFRTFIVGWFLSSLGGQEFQCEMKMLNQVELRAHISNGRGGTRSMDVRNRRDIGGRMRCHRTLKSGIYTV